MVLLESGSHAFKRIELPSDLLFRVVDADLAIIEAEDVDHQIDELVSCLLSLWVFQRFNTWLMGGELSVDDDQGKRLGDSVADELELDGSEEAA